MSSLCPDCGCPNHNCACVLRARMKAAEREAEAAREKAAEYAELWRAAASCLIHNRTRLARPRGEDERRLLTFLDGLGPTGVGHFWSGRTDGWLNWLPQPEPVSEEQDEDQPALFEASA